MKGVVQLVRDDVWTLDDAREVYNVLMEKITYLNNVKCMEDDNRERSITAKLQEEWFERAKEVYNRSDSELEVIEDILEKTYDKEHEWIPIEREYLQTFDIADDIPCDNHTCCWYGMNNDRLWAYERSYKSRFGTRTYCDVCVDSVNYGISDFAKKYSELFCEWLNKSNKRIKVDD